MLTDNEVPMSVAFNGRITPIQQAGAPVAIQWNEGLLARDDLAVIKGAKNKENAFKFCAFASLPAPQARFSMQIPYGFVNTKAAELIPAEWLATVADLARDSAQPLPARRAVVGTKSRRRA